MKVDKELVKKGLGIASIVMTGLVAVVSALSDQKKAAEFDDMKKAIEELQNQNK